MPAFTLQRTPRFHEAPAILAVGLPAAPFSAAEHVALQQAVDAGLTLCLLDARVDRATQLARFCRAHGGAFATTAVIAVSPLDTAAMVEVGMALALEDAGYDAALAADRVFPFRSEGGLEEAVRWLLRRLA